MVAPHLAEHKHGDHTVPRLAEVCASLVSRTLGGASDAKVKQRGGGCIFFLSKPHASAHGVTYILISYIYIIHNAHDGTRYTAICYYYPVAVHSRFKEID